MEKQQSPKKLVKVTAIFEHDDPSTERLADLVDLVHVRLSLPKNYGPGVGYLIVRDVTVEE